MKKTILPLACAVSLFAGVETLPATPENIAKFEQIVDIRTPQEWRETGIVKGAKTIQFTGDKYSFLEQLKKEVDLTKPVALICRSGARSASAANILDSSDVSIVNLDGGIIRAKKEGYELVPYKE